MPVKIPDLSTQERPIPQAGGGLASYRPDFGGGEQAGQAMMQTGKVIEHGGDEIYRAAKIEQEKIDTLKAEDAFTKLREKQLDLTAGEQNGYTRLRGAAAVNTDIRKDWSKKFGDEVTALEQGLQTEEQRVKFRQRANVAGLQFQEGILLHKNKESDIYAKEVFDGTIKSEVRQATANWQDPNAVALSISRIENAVLAQSERGGWPTEMRNAAMLQAQGQVHSAVIGQAIASGQWKYAEDWYKANKADIDLPTAKALETAVKDGTQKQLVGEYSMAVLGAKDNPDILRALSDKIFTDRTLDDTRKSALINNIDTRINRIEKKAETTRNIYEKEIERSISQINSTTLQGFDPPLDQVQTLINMAKGTRFEAEVHQLVNTINDTASFRKLPPDQQAAVITERTIALRTGASLAPKIKFSAAVEAHAPIIDAAAQKFGIDPTIMRAQIAQESGGNVNALSPKGAAGVSQFIPGTAARYGVDVKDPASSINGQGAYMKDLLAQFGGDYTKALAAYNMGEGSKEKGNGVEGLVVKWGDDWMSHAPKETQNYVATILKNAGGARAMRSDVNTLQRFEAIHAAQKRDLQESPTTYAVRQGLVAKEDPAATPLDMSDPAKLDYTALQRRVALARSLETQYGAPFKPLTTEEVALATATLKTLDTEGKRNYFQNLYQAAQNNAGTIVSGPRDDLGGARAYKAIMAQIAPDNPVLAHAGIAAARQYADPKQGLVADLILQGERILNPPSKQDGKPDSGKLIPMPPEQKMRMDFDGIVRDAYAGNPDARNGYYQTAKAIYAALSSKAGDKDTSVLDSTRWAESIKMATGEIVSWNGKFTPIPYGITPGDFKDRLKENITGLVGSGRLNASMTYGKLVDMKLEPVRDGVYVFREGDSVLADKAGRAVTVDLSRAAPPVFPQPINTGPPTAEELAAAAKPYLGSPRHATGSMGAR